MAQSFASVIMFCSVILLAVACSLPLKQDIVRIAKPFHDATSLCTNRSIIYARSRKLICLICKGLDSACFGITSTTTTSTTSTTTSTTTPASTTTSSTATPPTTTSATTSTTKPEGSTE